MSKMIINWAETWHVGKELQTIERTISQAMINTYAKAANDYNPIHVDEEYAKKSIFGSTTAHGFMLVGLLGTMLRQNFATAWLSYSTLEVRFRRPAKPGHVLTFGGMIESAKEDSVQCQIWVRNQLDEDIIVGKVTVSEKEEH